MNEFLQNVTEVQKVYEEYQVNRLLSEGWKLIHVATYSRVLPDLDFKAESGTEYIMARIQ